MQFPPKQGYNKSRKLELADTNEVCNTMDKTNEIQEIHKGLQTAYIDSNINSNSAYKPQIVFNNHKIGKIKQY